MTLEYNFWRSVALARFGVLVVLGGALLISPVLAQDQLPAAPNAKVLTVENREQAIAFLAADAAKLLRPSPATEFRDISGKPPSKPQVVVAGVWGERAKSSDLGDELALEFSDSLSEKAIGFEVVRRIDFVEKMAADHLPPDSFAERGIWRCYGLDDKNAVVVLGEVAAGTDDATLHLRATRLIDMKVLYDNQVRFPTTAEIQERAARPGEADSQKWIEGKPYWSDSGRDAHASGTPVDLDDKGAPGYTLPTCLECPHAGFSREASVAKTQGTVHMRVDVSAEGQATKIWIEAGLPCGLNDSAVEAVSHWKLKPATGPGGKPAEVIVNIEVYFQLY
jgi:TonB family protein